MHDFFSPPVVFRYPGDSSTFRTHLYFGVLGSVALLFATGEVVFLNRRPQAGPALSPRFAVRLVTGCLWMLEINFNNFIDPRNSKPFWERYR